MCYSVLCAFQNYMGDCALREWMNYPEGNEYEIFTKRFGYCPCFVGGLITSPEEEKKYEENKDRINEIINILNKEKKKWRKLKSNH